MLIYAAGHVACISVYSSLPYSRLPPPEGTPMFSRAPKVIDDILSITQSRFLFLHSYHFVCRYRLHAAYYTTLIFSCDKNVAASFRMMHRSNVFLKIFSLFILEVLWTIHSYKKPYTTQAFSLPKNINNRVRIKIVIFALTLNSAHVHLHIYHSHGTFAAHLPCTINPWRILTHGVGKSNFKRPHSFSPGRRCNKEEEDLFFFFEDSWGSWVGNLSRWVRNINSASGNNSGIRRARASRRHS